MIWGKKAEVIKATYRTEDGKEHESLLLCSGKSPAPVSSQKAICTW